MLWKNKIWVLLWFAGELCAADKALQEQRSQFLKRLAEVHNLSEAQTEKIKAIMERSPVMSTGNPAVTKHAATLDECRAKTKDIKFENPQFEKICGGKYLAPLYKNGAAVASAKVCIDQFEFPDIPCEYPLVWTQANEAAEICEAMGKRMCDAHEWEGACDGSLEAPDYDFALVKDTNPNKAVERMRQIHNQKFAPSKKWAYGKGPQKGICAANSTKAGDCNGGDWKRCGSNTYPTGMFPACKSSLEVYDQHGNAAEHMNLPLDESQMASRASKTLGHTEMKGSWFIFDKFQAHQDWCRWRAPYWHGTTVRDSKSHHNYHLGFRCCKTL